MWSRLPELTHLCADPGDVDPTSLLDTWRFLVSPDHTPVLATALGDLFLESSHDGIVFLDIGAATVQDAASSMDVLSALIWEDDNLNSFFFPDLVVALKESGLALTPGCCFHAITPPILGGQYTPSNYVVLDLASHVRGMGRLQSQLFGLPPGAHVVIR